MKLSVQHSSPASVEQVFASYVEKSVREEACRQSGALSYEVSVRQSADGGARVEVSRVMPASVPDFVRKFVGDSIAVRQVENWSAPDGQGTRHAVIRLIIDGQPASMVGTVQVIPDGTGSRELVTGEVKVAIPLLGRRVEPEIVKVIQAGLRVEQRVAGEWAQSSR